MKKEIMEMMHKPEVRELMGFVFMNNMQKEKAEKVRKYKMLNQYVEKGQILFVGSSLMEFFPINELQHTLDIKNTIYNRGVAGFVVSELLNSLEPCIFELEPSKIFINIGTNDIGSMLGEYQLDKLLEDYDKILTEIGQRLPECKVYVMAYYPVNAKAEFSGVEKSMKEILFKTRTNKTIAEANGAIEELAQQHGYEFIDVNEGLMNEENNLKKEYSTDGVHFYTNGYVVVLDNLKKYL